LFRIDGVELDYGLRQVQKIAVHDSWMQEGSACALRHDADARSGADEGAYRGYLSGLVLAFAVYVRQDAACEVGEVTRAVGRIGDDRIAGQACCAQLGVRVREGVSLGHRRDESLAEHLSLDQPGFVVESPQKRDVELLIPEESLLA